MGFSCDFQIGFKVLPDNVPPAPAARPGFRFDVLGFSCSIAVHRLMRDRRRKRLTPSHDLASKPKYGSRNLFVPGRFFCEPFPSGISRCGLEATKPVATNHRTKNKL
jgi:hypothetical protein